MEVWGERGYSGEGGRLGVGGGLVSREGNKVGVGWGRVGVGCGRVGVGGGIVEREVDWVWEGV